jgi:hypothetical protein
MSKTKERDKIEVVAINPVPGKDADGNDREEVFLKREDPNNPESYINEARYVKAGTYKLGTFTEDTIEKKAEG